MVSLNALARSQQASTGGCSRAHTPTLVHHPVAARSANVACRAALQDAEAPAAQAGAQQGAPQQPKRKQARNVQLSPALRRTTAILEAPNEQAPGGSTKVYILAMSHVSATSIDQLEELIREVQPEIVTVELCKDRLGFLAGDFPPGPRVWHCPEVKVTNTPKGSGFPSAEQLQGMLTCKPGRPVTSNDIDNDARTLLSTGICGAVRPNAQPPTNQDAPMFALSEDSDGDLRIETVPPFGSLILRCEIRNVPDLVSMECRLSSRAADAGIAISPERLQSVRDATINAVQSGKSDTIAALMGARARLVAEGGGAERADVVFETIEDGNVEAVVVPQQDADSSTCRSGLEGTAVNGRGVGIEEFKSPNQGEGVTIGVKSSLPAAVVDALARKAAVVPARESNGAASNGVAAPPVQTALGQLQSRELESAVARCRGRTQWRPWSWRERATAADEDPEEQPLKDLLAQKLTTWYGRLQGGAALSTGVERGDAWRAALDEAARCGTAQVLLADRPAFVTQRRLAQGIWGALQPRVVGGLVLFNAALVSGSFGVVDGDLAFNTALAMLAATALSFLPVALPFLEVWRFSKMPPQDIEKAVAVPEPIQDNIDQRMKLFGEDALLDWPGAQESIIAERDTYMARALAAAAQGRQGQVPAFVLDKSDGYNVMRYMMPEDAPNKAAPKGAGDGAYTPIPDAEAIVAVVGSAHVRGICQQWDGVLQQQKLSVRDLCES